MRLYKVCAWTDKQEFISDRYFRMEAQYAFIVVKGNSFDEIIPKIVGEIRKNFYVKNVDFKFERIPYEPDILWDAIYKDAKNDFRINIKDITDEDCRTICLKALDIRKGG